MRVGRNVFSNWTAFLVNMVVSFFLSPFMVHQLGPSGYGIWVLVGSLTGYLGVLDFGLRPTTVRFVSKYRTLGDDLMVNRVVNTILLILSIVAAVVVLASLILSFFASGFFKIPEEFHGQFRWIIIIVGLNVASSFPFSIFGSMLAALERFDLTNAIQVVVFLMRALLLVVFLKLGGGLVAVGVVVLSAGISTFLLESRFCLKLYPMLTINPRLADRESFKMIFAFSGYAFVMNIASRLSLQTSAIVLGAMISAEAITYYSIGSTMIDYLLILISYMSTTVLPIASGLDAKQDFDKLKQLLVIGTKYCVAVILPVSFSYLIVGEEFINLWMGPQFGEVSSKVLAILTCGYFGFLSQFVANSIFVGSGKLKYLAYLNMALAVVNVGLSIILVKWYGIFGCALGTAIPLLINGSLFYPIYACRIVKIGLWEYFLRSYFRPLAASIPFLAVIVIGDNLIDISNFAEFFAIVGAACVVHAFAIFYGILEPDHRDSVSQKIKEMIAKR